MPSLTLTFSGTNATRLAAAVGVELALEIDPATGAPIPATGPQIKAYIIRRLRRMVRDVERANVALADDVDIT